MNSKKKVNFWMESLEGLKIEADLNKYYFQSNQNKCKVQCCILKNRLIDDLLVSFSQIAESLI